MTVLIKILQVVLALSVLIVLHEFGHFTFAKAFGIRVDKFFLFFDAGGFKLFSTKSRWFVRICPAAQRWQTEYGIGWLPLGGYCKINGMVDESMDLESLKQEPKPWEFRSHPAWQRLLVMFGGVLFNFIGAFVIFTGFMAVDGRSYFSNDTAQIYVNDLSYEMGFRTGDHIISFDDYVPTDFAMLQADLARRNVGKATVLRGRDTVDIYIDRAMIGDVLQTPGMFDLAVPFIIDTVTADSPNASLGLRRGDRIVGIDGESVSYVQDSRPILARHAGGDVPLDVVRGADTLRLAAAVDSTGRIGVYMQMPQYVTKTYNVLEAIPAGVGYTFRQIRDYVSDLRMVATPSTGAYKSVGSFIAIGQVFPSSWDWRQFLYLVALLSVMLGVMNLIPIPGLDGGHIVFTLYEMVTGRKPSDSFLAVMQMIGLVLLLALMFLAFGNDIGRLVR